MTQRYTGIVATFNNLKGVGYLTCPGRADVYCHFSAIQRSHFPTLVAGETVEYTIRYGRNGEEAVDVIVLSPAEEPE